MNMNTRTCLLIYGVEQDIEWCKPILSAKNIAIRNCEYMSDLHEQMARHYDFAIILGDEIPDTHSRTSFTGFGEIISLLSKNNIDYLIIEGTEPNSRKILEFLEKVMPTKLLSEHSTIHWREHESGYEDRQNFQAVG